MIISGGSRSNWRFFAKHLTNPKDNDRVGVMEIRGVAADNVLEAFREMDAVASGTRCKNFFYHADINPRDDERLTPEQWEQAVDTLERNLGFEGQARMVVEHEKEGRVHRHVIWSRINADTMTALSDSLTARKHEFTSRALEQEFGLQPVASVLVKDRETPRPERRPKNWETFRGNKSGVDPEQVKAEVSALWNESDSGIAFRAGLEEHGYLLCKGDRRDFCLVDPAGDEHSLARRIAGAKATEIRKRLADIDREALPTVEEAKKRNTAGGRGDTQAHRRLRRIKLDQEMQAYLQDAENPQADETAKAARRAEKAKQRRARRADLLYHEKRIARGSSMASRDALHAAVSGQSASYTATEARERAAHAAALKGEMEPYVRAARQGRELQPAATFFDRASEFMRRAAREYREAAKDVKEAVKSSWTKYVQSRVDRKEQEPDLGR